MAQNTSQNHRCENVPACWRFVGGSSDCYLLTIVDDLLFSESSADMVIARRTCEMLSALWSERGARWATTFSFFFNPFPPPGISHGGPLGRRTRPAAAQAAPEVPW